jgi:hypothetical protein
VKDTLLNLILPVGLALISGAVVFGGKAARPMAITAFVLGVFAVCLVLVAGLQA